MLPNGVCEEGVLPLYLYMFEVGLGRNNIVTILNYLYMSLSNRQSKVGPGSARGGAVVPTLANLSRHCLALVGFWLALDCCLVVGWPRWDS